MTKPGILHAQYSAQGLDCAEVHPDPIQQFRLWFEQACDGGVTEPSAMVLSTVATDADTPAAPSARSVLMKAIDADGFTFFTNHASRKAVQMRDNAAVCALFPWYQLHRQVIIEGSVSRLDEARSAAYFHSRPRQAQLGACASRQSEPLASREVLERRVAQLTERYAGGEIPLPAFWGGYHLRPQRIEFWQGRDHRLHDRILYTRRGVAWQVSRLSP